jgi:hypothetical protein
MFWNETSGLPRTYDKLRYQSQLCRAMCIHDQLYSQCGCSMPDIAELSIVNTTFCTLADMTCIAEFSAAFEESEESVALTGTGGMCPCAPECHEKAYLATLSSVQWPSNSYWPYLAQRLVLLNAILNAHLLH